MRWGTTVSHTPAFAATYPRAFLSRISHRAESARAKTGYIHVPNCVWHARAGNLRWCRPRCKFKLKSSRVYCGSNGTMKTTEQSRVSSAIFIGRWTPRVLFSLKERPHRHGELRRRVGDVSQRMLTRTLRNLELAGLVVRHATGSKTLAVEYSLSQLGRTMIAPLRGMCRWARTYRKSVTADVYFPEANQTQ